MNLQRLFIEKKRDFIHNDGVQNLVCELLICLFIQTFNYEVNCFLLILRIDHILFFKDQDGGYISDSFSELPEQADNEP